MRALVFSGPAKAEVADVPTSHRPRPGRGHRPLAHGRRLPFRPRAAGRPLHHPDQLPDHPGPRMGGRDRRGRPGRPRTSAPAIASSASAWSAPAARITSGSRSQAPPPSIRRPGRMAAQAPRAAELHHRRAGRAVHRRLRGCAHRQHRPVRPRRRPRRRPDRPAVGYGRHRAQRQRHPDRAPARPARQGTRARHHQRHRSDHGKRR